MANEIMLREQQFLNTVSTELTQRLVNESKAVGGTFNSQRFVMNSIEALRQLELLDKPVSPTQVVNGLMKGAYLNLDFFRRECYLIYYKGKGLQFQTDYKGEVKLVKKHSIKPIYEIFAEVVREGDDYEKIIVQGQRTINHKPKRFNTGKIEGAYAHVKYVDGSTDMVDISVIDIEIIRNKYSKAPTSGAWVNRYEEMCKKTVLRLLCKNIQLDFSKEQYEAYQEGGVYEFDKTHQLEEKAINPFETPQIEEQSEEPTVIEAEVVVTPSASEEAVEEPKTGLTCSVCGSVISEKVYTFSVDKFGQPLCFNCQKKGK